MPNARIAQIRTTRATYTDTVVCRSIGPHITDAHKRAPSPRRHTVAPRPASRHRPVTLPRDQRAVADSSDSSRASGPVSKSSQDSSQVLTRRVDVRSSTKSTRSRPPRVRRCHRGTGTGTGTRTVPVGPVQRTVLKPERADRSRRRRALQPLRSEC